ncbi:XylR N-terminal domain-containing protein [Bacillus sp. REN10]|uniref:XylR N-terminal domain-containing protein n=1 Tax=Bacillus sp. REN10 TaxID=2782541 RepID=UPI00193BEC6F|nr:XylR N-terminal domain-containing protein [Bacillus sp. REN10]
MMETEQSLLKQLNITCKDGMVYADHTRSILISIEAFGTLRRDLIENIGLDRMKAFFFRYGWQIGWQDGEKALAAAFDSLEEQVKYGPVLHSLKGHVQATMDRIRIVEQAGKVQQFHMEGVWRHSYEAVEHVTHLGLSDVPVCFTLTGYASGYVTRLVGETVIFKETQCIGTGAEDCRWVGKLASEWGEEASEQIGYCEEQPILRELEVANEKLLEEKNHLAKVMLVHKLLTEEIIKGNHLDSIVQVMYEQTGIPVLIENIHHQPLAYKGIHEEWLQQAQQELIDRVLLLEKTKWLRTASCYRLMSPVFLQGKKVGYCSFFLEENQVANPEILTMFIERMCSVCSLVLLNEKTKFESAERMKGRFLDEILSGKYTDEQEIVKRASLISLDLSKAYYFIVVHYQLAAKDIKKELTFYEQILETTANFFKQAGLHALIGQRDSAIIALVSDPKGEVASLCEALLQELSNRCVKVECQVGISLKNDHILQAREAYEEALTALRMASRQLPIVHFESLGIVGMLINSNNEAAIEKIAKYTLGALYDTLDEKKVELLNTLYTFLLNGGNLEATADELALSVSGLRYRMSKIDQILDVSLRDAEATFQLLLSLKSLKSIGKLDL